MRRERLRSWPGVCLTVICALPTAAAQEAPRWCCSARAPYNAFVLDDSSVSVGDDVSSAWGAFTHTVTAPARWRRSDALTFAIALVATVGAVAIEEDVREFFQKNQGSVGDTFERLGFVYGSPIFTIPVSLATYTIGVFTNSNGVRETGLMMTEAMLMVALVRQPLRMAVGRARPLTEEGHVSFQPFTFENDYASFISGHAWSAFGISTVLAQQIGSPWASAGLYTLSTITAVSRLYADKHWLSDVVMGSALGFFSTRTIWRWHSGRTGSSLALEFYPVPSGFVARFEF